MNTTPLQVICNNYNDFYYQVEKLIENRQKEVFEAGREMSKTIRELKMELEKERGLKITWQGL